MTVGAALFGYYDKGPVNMRLSWSWRDEYFLQIGQGLDFVEPTFVNARAQLDLSGSYGISRTLSVFGYVSNLTGAPYSTHGRYPNQLLLASASSRRIMFGLRFHN